MLKKIIIKTAALAALSIAAAASLLGCGSEKTVQASPLRTFSTTPAQETMPVQSASATPNITLPAEPQSPADATSSATVTAPAGSPADATSSATVTAPAGGPVDATSSATVKGGEDEEDDD